MVYRTGRSPVYPRWRGEHFYLMRIRRNIVGLSPLARGTRPVNSPSIPHLRFIPAGAGNTVVIRMALSWTSVYPRWRGEHAERPAPSRHSTGLSPLARGTHLSDWDTVNYVRFIPAGAGNTRSMAVCAGSSSVYPRWRGEHAAYVGAQGVAFGLSPLARGTRRSNSSSGICGAVYPRWRGEHSKTTQLNFKPFLAYKKSTNFSVFLKIANSLI